MNLRQTFSPTDPLGGRSGVLITVALILVMLGMGACSAPSVRQDDLDVPLALPRPEVTVQVGFSHQTVSVDKVEKRFLGRVVDRREKEQDQKTTGGYSIVLYEFLVLDSDGLEPEQVDGRYEKATLTLGVPYKAFPRLRIGADYLVVEVNQSTEAMGVPDLSLSLFTREGEPVFILKSLASCKQVNPMGELEIGTDEKVSYYSDMETPSGCRVQRRHYDTRVSHPEILGDSISLKPGEYVQFSVQDEVFEVMSIDNSLASTGPCDELIRNEQAHCSFIVRSVD